MTDVELQAIRDRCEKASSGPWVPYLNDGDKLLCSEPVVGAIGGEVVRELPIPSEADTISILDRGELLPSGCAPIASHRWLPTKYDPATGESPVPDEYMHLRAADAVFIAHARQDIPALLAEVERLRAAMKQLLIEERYQEALAAEREACAREAETNVPPMLDDQMVAYRVAEHIAAAIRARGTPLTPLP